MSLLTVRQAPDPMLREPASAVRVMRDQELSEAIALGGLMLQTMREWGGVGLAANQVGRLVRVIVVDLGGEPYVMVNPRITKLSPELQLSREGCLSIEAGRRQGQVYRAKRIVVEWVDEAGESRKQKFAGLIAAVIQHEVDHLDGVLWTDKAVGNAA